MSVAFFEEPNFEQETYQRSQRLLREGFQNFIIMGGDGTFHQAVNAVLHSDTPLADVSFLFLPCGTGNDWRRTTGVPTNPLKALDLLTSGIPTYLDLGIAEFYASGKPQKIGFINIAGMAYDAYVTEHTNNSGGKKRIGRLAYQWKMFQLLLRYRKGSILCRLDNEEKIWPRALSLCVGCGCFNGNGMMQLPMAHPSDGLLDVAVIGDISRWDVILQTPNLYKGLHIRHPKVSTFRGQHVEVRTDPPSLLECEGEVYAPENSVKFSILPRAWKILLPPNAAQTFH